MISQEAERDAWITTAITLRNYIKLIKQWHELPMVQQVMLKNDLERDLGAIADFFEYKGKKL